MRETDREAPGGVAVISHVFDCWAREDLPGLLEVFDEACEVRPLLGQLDGAVYRGHDGVRRWFTDMRSDWSAFSPELQKFSEAGDSLLVAGRVRVRGHHSGADLDTRFWWRFSFRNGRILVMEAAGEPTDEHLAAGLGST